MNRWSMSIPLAVWLFCGPAAGDEDALAIARLHHQEAAAYTLRPEAPDAQPLQLRDEPVFKWQNLLNNDSQSGSVYVWQRDGRPEAIGTIFSVTQPDHQRKIVHEFHTLSTESLRVTAPADIPYRWQPRGTLQLHAVEDPPPVGRGAAQRLLQMKQVAHRLTARSWHQDVGDETILRLVPHPLLRYESASQQILDGALFAFVSGAAGTDPEVLLLVEARPAANGGDVEWHYALASFSDRHLEVQAGEQVLFDTRADERLTVTIEESYRLLHNGDDTYYCTQARVIADPLPLRKE